MLHAPFQSSNPMPKMPSLGMRVWHYRAGEAREEVRLLLHLASCWSPENCIAQNELGVLGLKNE